MPTSPYFVNDKQVPSVSAIIDYDPDPKKGTIVKWAKRKEAYDAKHGDGAWDAMLAQTSNRGNILHSMALEACLLNGVDPDEIHCQKYNTDGTPNEIYEFWEGNKSNGLKYWVKSLLKEDFKIISVEKPFVHQELFYGGTPDLGIQKDNQGIIIDLKTYHGYDSDYRCSKDQVNRCKKYYGVQELDKNKKYKLYGSQLYWSVDDEAWRAIYSVKQYQLHRRSKKGEHHPSFKGWDWYHEKLKRAFKQCLLYRELLQHNGFPIHNVKVVCASRYAGVKEFPFFDYSITKNQNNLLKLYNDAHAEVMQQLISYHNDNTSFNLNLKEKVAV